MITKGMLICTLLEKRIECEDIDDMTILGELLILLENYININDIEKDLKELVIMAVFNAISSDYDLIREQKIELWYNQLKNFIEN